jgi:hypothetical protein
VAQILRSCCAIDAKSLAVVWNRSEIAAQSLLSRFELSCTKAAQFLCNRYGIAARSFGIAAKSLRSRCAVAAQKLRSRCAIYAKTLRGRFVVAAKSLRSRFESLRICSPLSQSILTSFNLRHPCLLPISAFFFLSSFDPLSLHPRNLIFFF